MAITKRYNAPVFWPVKRKENKFTVTPSSGPHPKKLCVPLAILIRDYLGIAKTLREVKIILLRDNVKINGKIRRKYNFPIGLMDIVQLGDTSLIALPSRNGISFIKTKELSRLAKIQNKKILKKGRIQLNLHDGTNLITEDNEINPNDVLVLGLDGKIKDILKFQSGSLLIITKGSNAGKVGHFKKLIKRKDCKENIVVVKISDKTIEVPLSYTFTIGKDTPLIPVKTDGESHE